MANEKNLIDNSQRTPSERREIARKGGIESGKARRRKKLLKDTVNMLVALPMKEGQLDKLTSLQSINGKNITVEEAMVLKQIQKALKGDLNAFKSVIDLTGSNAENMSESKKQETDNAFIDALNSKAACNGAKNAPLEKTAGGCQSYG